MDPNGYVTEIRTVSEELKRLEKRAKLLREQRRITQGRLYDYMYQHNLKEFGGITSKSIAPKPKKIAKTKEEKKDDAIALFRTTGVPNPESFYEEFIKTQKTDETPVKHSYY